jgi:hypothetical protein
MASGDGFVQGELARRWDVEKDAVCAGVDAGEVSDVVDGGAVRTDL